MTRTSNEWWYFDIHNHDETVITGMLSPQSAIGACLVSGRRGHCPGSMYYTVQRVF